ncbi:phage tail tube protein [Fusobacterium hominis]|uniref:phage tail tube protein n=1 Tax=Fusobacterium hominis TaxID=2764326 RepID=UPI0022E4C719|nr:phage tail tube protein [Fusobacterium hominis]
MEKNINGTKVISGTHGLVWINNEKVAEFKSFKAEITTERKDVQLGMSVDSKIVGLKGEGTLVINKVYTRGKKIFESWKKGKDYRARIVSSVQDPDSFGEERVSIDNVWFNKLSLANLAKGEVIEEEIPFGFTPSDADYENAIG